MNQVDLLIDVFFKSKDDSSLKEDGYDYVITQRPFELWVDIKNISNANENPENKVFQGFIWKLFITFGNPNKTHPLINRDFRAGHISDINLSVGKSYTRKIQDIDHEISGELLATMNLVETSSVDKAPRRVNFYRKNSINGKLERLSEQSWSKTYYLETERQVLKEIKEQNYKNDTRNRSNIIIFLGVINFLCALIFRACGSLPNS